MLEKTNETERKVTETSCTVKRTGKIKLMCPHCFGLTKCERKSTFEAEVYEIMEPDFLVGERYVLTCPVCKHRAAQIELDFNIANSIAVLNTLGYFTRICCEGHDESNDINIGFVDELPVSTPQGWHFEKNKTFIQSDNAGFATKEQDLQALYRWCCNLPPKVKTVPGVCITQEFCDEYDMHSLSRMENATLAVLIKLCLIELRKSGVDLGTDCVDLLVTSEEEMSQLEYRMADIAGYWSNDVANAFVQNVRMYERFPVFEEAMRDIPANNIFELIYTFLNHKYGWTFNLEKANSF